MGKHYINNENFLEEIIKSKKQDKLTEQALQNIMQIIDGVVKNLYYKNPKDREDCIGICVETVLRYWRGFDPDKGHNAFAYYTQMTKNGLAKGWKDLHPIRRVQQISINEIDIQDW